jgi:hypothetical protein
VELAPMLSTGLPFVSANRRSSPVVAGTASMDRELACPSTLDHYRHAAGCLAVCLILATMAGCNEPGVRCGAGTRNEKGTCVPIVGASDAAAKNVEAGIAPPPSLPCGEGTHAENGVCVANAPTVAAHPKITSSIIARTLRGRSVAHWQFERDTPMKVSVVEQTSDGDKAVVIAHVAITSGLFRPAGRLRLHYEWIAGEWNFIDAENLSFKK